MCKFTTFFSSWQYKLPFKKPQKTYQPHTLWLKTGELLCRLLLSVYPEGESNSYLKFRKLLFYPLNYRGISKVKYIVNDIVMTTHNISSCKIISKYQNTQALMLFFMQKKVNDLLFLLYVKKIHLYLYLPRNITPFFIPVFFLRPRLPFVRFLRQFPLLN